MFYATRLFQNELYQGICFLDLVSSSHNILAFSSRQWAFFSMCAKVYLLGTKVNQPPVFTQMHNVSVSNQTRLKAETSTRYMYRWWDMSSQVTVLFFLWPFRNSSSELPRYSVRWKFWLFHQWAKEKMQKRKMPGAQDWILQHLPDSGRTFGSGILSLRLPGPHKGFS